MTHNAALLPGWPDALEDACFPHGVEFLHGIVLLVEVSIGLFPRLCHRVLRRTTSGFSYSPTLAHIQTIKYFSTHFIVKVQLYCFI